MSERASVVVAAIALVAVLCLAAPVPAHAAPIRAGLPSITLWERAWNWLMELVPGVRWEKEGGMINPDGARQTALWEKEGSMINPDGRTTPSTSPPAPPADGLNEGSAINPDGSK